MSIRGAGGRQRARERETLKQALHTAWDPTTLRS